MTETLIDFRWSSGQSCDQLLRKCIFEAIDWIRIETTAELICDTICVEINCFAIWNQTLNWIDSYCCWSPVECRSGGECWGRRSCADRILPTAPCNEVWRLVSRVTVRVMNEGCARVAVWAAERRSIRELHLLCAKRQLCWVSNDNCLSVRTTTALFY